MKIKEFLEENDLPYERYKYDFRYIIINGSYCLFELNGKMFEYDIENHYKLVIEQENRDLYYYHVSLWKNDDEYDDYLIDDDTFTKLQKMLS